MSSAFAPHSYPYLTVITWPEGFVPEHAVQLLGPILPLDEPTIRMRADDPAPMILGQFDPPTTDAALEAMLRHSIDCFAPTLADIEALGPTHKIRDLRVESGYFVIDLWRSDTPVGLPFKNVQVLVRAHLSDSVTKSAPSDAPQVQPYFMLRQHTWAARREWERSARTTELRTSDRIDIHVADGTVLQIDGDKFGYSALGEMKGGTDRVNMDRMLELLDHLCNRAIIDDFYELFAPPASHKRLRLPLMRVNNDDVAFAFYSRWSALIYRHVLAGGA